MGGINESHYRNAGANDTHNIKCRGVVAHTTPEFSKSFSLYTSLNLPDPFILSTRLL